MAEKSDESSGNQERIVSHAIVRELGDIVDIEKMCGKSRRHVVTYADTWAPGEPLGKLLPAELKKDTWCAFRIHVGEASHCQQVKDMDLGKKRVGVAENPRSGVGARGSSVKKGFLWEKNLVFRNPCAPPS